MHRMLIELLHESRAPRVFVEIASGLPRPPLTEFRLQPIPPDWDSIVPPDLVAGHRLVPFGRTSGYTIYCIDADTLQIVSIDMEEPWPPTKSFVSWQSFAAELLAEIAENEPEAESVVRALFLGDE